jgi:hypothetical protein
MVVASDEAPIGTLLSSVHRHHTPTPMLNAATIPMVDFLAGFLIIFFDPYGKEPRLSLLGE